MVTIDANVFVSANSSAEVQHAVSAAFFGAVLHHSASIYCPCLVMPEVGAGMFRPTNNAALARRTAFNIRQLPGLILISQDEARAEQAVEVSIRYRLKGPDAVYVALAQEFGTTLITWDGEVLARAVQAVPTMTPTEWLAANPV